MSQTKQLPLAARVFRNRRPPWLIAGTVLVAPVVAIISASFIEDFRAQRRYRVAVAPAHRLDRTGVATCALKKELTLILFTGKFAG
jgi:hypothetical protein